MRKYRSADAFSDQRQQQLAALEQRLALLDDQLLSVEALIAERFPGLGLPLLDHRVQAAGLPADLVDGSSAAEYRANVGQTAVADLAATGPAGNVPPRPKLAEHDAIQPGVRRRKPR